MGSDAMILAFFNAKFQVKFFNALSHPHQEAL